MGMNDNVTFNITPAGGRVFATGFRGDGIPPISAELKCDYFPSLYSIFVPDAEFGRKPSSSTGGGYALTSLPIILSLREADDDWREDSEGFGDRRVGSLQFWEEMEASRDGVVSAGLAYVSATVIVDRATMAMVIGWLPEAEKGGLQIAMTIQFPEECVDRGWTGSRVRWGGDGTLVVPGISFVWSHADYKLDRDHSFDEIEDAPEPKEVEPKRHQQEVLAATDRLERAIAALATPTWAAVLLLAWLAFGR